MTTNSLPFLTRRTKVLLAFLAVLLIVAVGWGSRIRREVLIRLVPNSDAPPPSAIEELVRSDDGPLPFLSRLWRAGNVVHRQLAMDALKQRSHRKPAEKAMLSELTLPPRREPAKSGTLSKSL